MHSAYLALGSNIEPRRAYLKRALDELSCTRGVTLTRTSPLYDTFPLGCADQPRFLNCVSKITTPLDPGALLGVVQKIERKLGRRRTRKNGPRVIDLDILLYDRRLVRQKNLRIPHPRLHMRKFLLAALQDIDEAVYHPAMRHTVEELYAARHVPVFRSPAKLSSHVRTIRARGLRIGFVPTMGCLHEGHARLIEEARRATDYVVSSIFVNPSQFGKNEDYAHYPRRFLHDVRYATRAGADCIFHPGRKTMYPEGYATTVSVSDVTQKMCGLFRPGHFDGVATIMAQLLEIVHPDILYVGQKDLQQVVVLKRMIKDLKFAVRTHMVGVVREKDGLAVSSRNRYLSSAQRRQAPVIYEALQRARATLRRGMRASGVRRQIERDIASRTDARVQYVAIVDPVHLRECVTIQKRVAIATAVFFGRTRLIDNIIVDVKH